MSLSPLKPTIIYGNFYGLFVGVEKFPNSRGEIPSLMHSNEDADQVCQIFLEQRGQGQHQYDLCLLVDKDYRIAYHEAVDVQEATRANILRELTRCLKMARSNDFVLVYISTHGIIDYDDYFFLPSDSELDNVLGTGIASTTIIGAIGKATGRGVKALLIIDTCHAGAVTFDISKYKGEFACLLASSPVEYSYEYFTVEHGVFTDFLLEGFKGAARKESQLTLISLYDYVYENVQERTGKRQNPLLIGTMNYETVLIQPREGQTERGKAISD